MSNRNRTTKLLTCKEILGVSTNEDHEQGEKPTWEELLTRITGIDPRLCPHCGKGKMLLKEVLLPTITRAPP